MFRIAKCHRNVQKVLRLTCKYGYRLIKTITMIFKHVPQVMKIYEEVSQRRTLEWVTQYRWWRRKGCWVRGRGTWSKQHASILFEAAATWALGPLLPRKSSTTTVLAHRVPLSISTKCFMDVQMNKRFGQCRGRTDDLGVISTTL